MVMVKIAIVPQIDEIIIARLDASPSVFDKFILLIVGNTVIGDDVVFWNESSSASFNSFIAMVLKTESSGIIEVDIDVPAK